MGNRLLTGPEVALLLGLSAHTIRTRRGGTETIPRVKIGRAWRYVEADVQDWIEERVSEARGEQQGNVYRFKPREIHR